MISLERVETEDGLWLDGAWWQPEAGIAERLPAGLRETAFLLVHGTGSNFYHPGVLERFARGAVSLGMAAWRVNTRGHDGMASIPGRRGSVPGGATFEQIEEAPLDLNAWIERVSRDASRVILVGHSMGAVKSLAFAARETPSALAGVIALSPPRFCHDLWMTHPRAAAFRESWQQASELVPAGRGDEFLPVKQPVPFLATAAGFLAKYGPGDRFDVVRTAPSVACPALVMIGTRSAESSPAFDGLAEQLSRIAEQRSSLTVVSVSGADTGYHGHEETAFQIAWEWLTRLFAG